MNIIILFIIISLIGKRFQTININFTLPNVFTLLDGSNMFVAEDGIHFYNQEFDQELTGKKIELSLGLEDMKKLLFAQFSNEGYPYILLYVKKKIYIFDEEKSKIKEQAVTLINDGDIHLKLIPYKIDNNILYFFISFYDYNHINLLKFTFNLQNPLNDIYMVKEPILVPEGGNNIQICGLSSVLIPPYEPLDITNDLLTFFYFQKNPLVFHSFTIELGNVYKKIESLEYSQNINVNTGDQNVFTIKALANSKKEKVLLYVIIDFLPYSGVFDYNNKLSDFQLEYMGDHTLLNEEHTEKHKLYYFEKTKEFLSISEYNSGCGKFIMVFHDNCKLNYKGSLLYDNQICGYTHLSTVFHNGLNYTIITNIQNGPISLVNLANEIVLDIPYNHTYYGEETEIPTTTTIPTTIITTIPTTIITTIPTTILTTTPTTIITTIPTTIITTIPTTIITTIPTTIITTIPTTILTTIPTTIITTIPTTIITTIPTTNPTTIITTIPTTIITTIPTTIPTTILTTIPTILTTSIENPTTFIDIPTTIIGENYSNNIKCKESTYKSAQYNLCTSCNEEEQYFPGVFPNNDFLHGFIECFNITTKPINFYFDNLTKKFKPCYETCLTCNYGGNGDINNCLTCEINFIKKPESPDTTNCVTECYYAYYYSPYGQYKCTNNSNCPDEAHLYIKDLKKCTNNCKKENKYKYQYGGQCLESCPKDTEPNNENICIDKNFDSCSKSEDEIDLQEFLTTWGVDTNAKNYAKEFIYTEKHVSHYYDNMYSILLYKDMKCIEELSINMPKIDFGKCYEKVLDSIIPKINGNLIVGLVERENGQNKPSISYFFYHPETGNKIDADLICKDEEIEITESVLNQLNNSDIDLDSILYLANQDINIFNLSDAFYTDICYNFKSPNGKDVPLGDRIKSFYPNITLCDSGCTSKGVNLTTMESICTCKFNDILSNDLIEGNAFIQSALGGITDLVKSSNILVLKCYKNVFKKENIKKGVGGYFILSILFFQILFSLFFLINDMPRIRKYLYNLTEQFMEYISKKEQNENIDNPPKKRQNKKRKNNL